MVSCKIAVIVLAAVVQATVANYGCYGGCGGGYGFGGPVFEGVGGFGGYGCGGPVFEGVGGYGGYGCGGPVFEGGCGCACPGPIVEQTAIVSRPVSETVCSQAPVFSRQCGTVPAGVDVRSCPYVYETAPVCQTQEALVQVPSVDIGVSNTPLCQRTCTTNNYLIQIPVSETYCTSAPLCQQTTYVRPNVETTVSRQTQCAKQVCAQNQVVETPYFDTVCQDYGQTVTNCGTVTSCVPEVVKSCFQLPPQPCAPAPCGCGGGYGLYGNYGPW